MASGFSANIEHWPLERLIPHARNARTHSEEQVAQMRDQSLSSGS